MSTAPVDFSKLGGLWVPCAGSVTPWGTHLGSEEYEPDARTIEEAASLKEIGDYNLPMALYFGYDPYAPGATADGFRKVFNPYNYGWATEITVDESGKAEAAKHYAMGRIAPGWRTPCRTGRPSIRPTTAPTPGSSCSSPTRPASSMRASSTR